MKDEVGWIRLRPRWSRDRTTQPKESSYGVLAALKLDISSEDIDQARREMWGNFAREDI